MPQPQRLEFPPYTLWEMRAGSGTPLILLHGLSGSSNWWTRNFQTLAEHHTVAAVDLVGFGRSSHFLGMPHLLPPFGEVTALLARWLETFEQPVHLAGHSMGGQIAVRLAAERPDLVRSLTLVSAAGIPFSLDPRPHVRPLAKPPYGGAGIARVLVPDFLRAGPASVAVATTRVVLGDMRSMMHALRMPVLLVWGENDPLVPLVYGEAMQREIEGSRLVVLPRAAHVPMWDTPEAFNAELLRFLDEVDALSPGEPGERLFSWGIAGCTDGIIHRQPGRSRELVLVHGLGMSSAYLGPLARALFARGASPVAPDLPGFGESVNAPAMGPEEQASALARWADALGISNAVWAGHSIGCNTVAHLARIRPDLVRGLVLIGPLWTTSRWPQVRTFAALVADAFREPLSLFRYVLRAYWRTGGARWLATWWRFAADVAREPDLPRGALLLAGERDPLPDPEVTPVARVPGAHACVFSHPEEIAERMMRESGRDGEPVGS